VLEKVETVTTRILRGDVREMLKMLESDSVDCVITSPPYWGLRSYLPEDHVDKAKEIGLEPTLGEHLTVLVELFREMRRVLKPSGTFWLNYGDCYATSPNGRSAADTKALAGDDRTFRDKPMSTVGPIYSTAGTQAHHSGRQGRSGNLGNGGINGAAIPDGRIVAGGYLKPKDLCLIPNRLVQALQEPYYTGDIKSFEDRVWLAALIDGEGSIYINRQPAGTPTGRKESGSVRSQDNFCVGIAISNTSLAIVEKCAAIFGKTNIQTYEPKGGNRRRHHQWRVTGNIAKRILQEVYPHLVGKRQEARIAIACPPSGDVASATWQALKDLHKTGQSDFDAKPPASCYEQGWWVRSEIIWGKRNPMPDSSGRFRPSTAHEKIFLLAKSDEGGFWVARDTGEVSATPDLSERCIMPTSGNEGARWIELGHYYNAEASALPASPGTHARLAQNVAAQVGSTRANGGRKTNGNMKAVSRQKDLSAGARPPNSRPHNLSNFEARTIETAVKKQDGHSRRDDGFNERYFGERKTAEAGSGIRNNSSMDEALAIMPETRFLRNYEPARLEVWDMSTQPFSEAHFATFPPELVERCITAGCPEGGLVLDVFGGSGTTGLVADRMGRNAILIELSDEYADMAKRRISRDSPLFSEVTE
jgi:DNA modification methylase